MILFNLICAAGHEFEGWFRDGAAYDAQVAAGDVACPQCGDCEVRKAPMAPSVISGYRATAPSTQPVVDAETAKAVREVLTNLRRHIEDSCVYVGERFAEEARRIHYGESEKRPIYGEASAAETRALCDEGVEVAAIPWLPRHDG